jgi:hypothetical protein
MSLGFGTLLTPNGQDYNIVRQSGEQMNGQNTILVETTLPNLLFKRRQG